MPRCVHLKPILLPAGPIVATRAFFRCDKTLPPLPRRTCAPRRGRQSPLSVSLPVLVVSRKSKISRGRMDLRWPLWRRIEMSSTTTVAR